MHRASRRIIGIFGTIVIIYILGAGIGFYEDFIKPIINPTPTPYPTIPPPPTSRPRPTPTDSCLIWSQVTYLMEGQYLCVYGTVFSIYQTDNSWTRIKFSSFSDTFFIEDINYTYPDLKPGNCVQAYGIIRLYGKIPHIQTEGELYICN